MRRISTLDSLDRISAPGSAVRLGKYTLLTRLASGGMGEVYVAHLAGTAGFEKQVVIKRILPHLADDQAFVDMFLHEARLTAQLNHPNICQVFELGQDDGEFYIAMEYLEGLPLTSLIKARPGQGLDNRIVAGLLMQACEGLEHAHGFRDSERSIDGIVHRDISPQNLFVTNAGVVKVLDFGVAKLYREGSKTVTGSAKGKYNYMSPEQVKGEPLDRRSDIFALGVVLFESLTGRRLFRRETEFHTFEAIVRGIRPKVLDYRPDVPIELHEVVEKALSLDPKQRFATARSMAQAISHAMVMYGGPASTSDIAEFVSNEHGHKIREQRDRVNQAYAILRAESELMPAQMPAQMPASMPTSMAMSDEAPRDRSLRQNTMPATPRAHERSGVSHVPAAVDNGDISGLSVATGTSARFGAAPVTGTSGRFAAAPVTGSAARLPAPDVDGVSLSGAELTMGLPQPSERSNRRWILVGALLVALIVPAAFWFGQRSAGVDTGLPGHAAKGAELADSTKAQGDTAPRGTGQAAGVIAAAGAESAARAEDAGAAERNAEANSEANTDQDTEPTGPTGPVGPTGNDEDEQAERSDSKQRRRSSDSRGSRTEDSKPSKEPGYFTVDAVPYAEIYINREKMGITPLVRIPLPPGKHSVRAVTESGESKRFSIKIEAGKTATRRITFSPSSEDSQE